MSNPFPPLKPPQVTSRTMSTDPKPPLAGLDPLIKVGSIVVALALAWAALDARSQAAQQSVADHEARLRVIERDVLSSLARIEQRLVQIERATP
jgi:hypothetical protein